MLEILCWLIYFLSCGFVDWRDHQDDKEHGDLEDQLLHAPSERTGEELDGLLRAAQSKPRLPKRPNTNNILGLGTRDVREDYELGDVIGEGAFGLVRRCKNRRTGDEFACKTLEKSQMKRRADVEDIRREVQILMMLSSHPNVAALVGIYEDPSAVRMILELCQGGTILDEIVAQSKTYSERSAAKIFRKMVEVVQHCHVLGIAHRDIKPENFLMSVSGPQGEVKAADFGLSQFFRHGKSFKSLVGSAYYVAPEVLARNYGPKADIWSLGVCAYVLLTGLPPFYGQTEEEIFAMICHSNVDFSPKTWPTCLSPAAKDCIDKMLQKDPNNRPSADQLLRHKWLCAAAPNVPLGDTVIARIAAFAALTRVKRAATVIAAQNLDMDDQGARAVQFAATVRTQSMLRDGKHMHAKDGDLPSTSSRPEKSSNTVLSKKAVAGSIASETGMEWEGFGDRLKHSLGVEPDAEGMVPVDDLTSTLSKYGLSEKDCASLLKDPRVAHMISKDGERVMFEQFLRHLMEHQTNSYLEAVRIKFKADSSPEYSACKSVDEVSSLEDGMGA